MKQIFLSIQKKLAEIAELKHIDKNWNQLLHEKPPVKFPCALLDIANVDYSQLGCLAQTANATIEITIANLQLTPSSGKAPRKHESYTILEIIEKIHQLLHGWSDGKFQLLTRTNLQKLDATYAYEIYKISYKTTWDILKESNHTPVQVRPLIKQM